MNKNLLFFKKKIDNNSLLILSDSNFNNKNLYYYKNHPWNDDKIYYKDYRYISKLENKFKDILKKKFEKKFFLKKSKKYWDIICFPSLYYSLAFLRSRFVVLEKIFKKKKYKNFYLPTYNLNEWIPEDTNDLMQNIKNTDFSSIIYCEIAKLFFKNIKDKKKFFKKKKIINRNFSKRLRIYNFLNFRQSNTIINEDYLNLKISKLKDHKNYFFNDNFLSKKNQNLFDRNEVLNFEKSLNDDLFIKISKHLLKYFIPKSIIENLECFRNMKNIKNIVSGTKIVSDDNFKKFCANNVCGNQKLYIIQHGGSYNSNKFNPSEDREKKISNFICWGKYKSVKLLSATKLIGRQLKNNFKSNKVIFFAQNFTMKVNHFNDGPYTPLKHIEFQKQQIKSINSLSKIIPEKIYVKVPPFNINESNTYIYDALKNTKTRFINKKCNIDLILKEFKYAYTMDNGTIFLELIGLNYPCFLINQKFSIFNNKFKKELKNLKKINIVFDTIEEFIFFLKKTDLDLFWKKTQKNKIFLKFQKNYCYLNSDNPYKEWKKFLKSL